MVRDTVGSTAVQMSRLVLSPPISTTGLRARTVAVREVGRRAPEQVRRRGRRVVGPSSTTPRDCRTRGIEDAIGIAAAYRRLRARDSTSRHASSSTGVYRSGSRIATGWSASTS